MKRVLWKIFTVIMTIEELKQRGYTPRVVVVDGGSKDKTLEIVVKK